MSLRQTMQAQEQRNLWSLRWLIVAAFVQAGGVIYLGLGAEGRAEVPAWAFFVWGVLALFVVALAAIAKAMHPKGDMMNLPLGPALAPTVLLRRATDRPPQADELDAPAQAAPGEPQVSADALTPLTELIQRPGRAPRGPPRPMPDSPPGEAQAAQGGPFTPPAPQHQPAPPARPLSADDDPQGVPTSPNEPSPPAPDPAPDPDTTPIPVPPPPDPPAPAPPPGRAP